MAGDGTFEAAAIYLAHVTGSEINGGIVGIFNVSCAGSFRRANEVVRKSYGGVAPDLRVFTIACAEDAKRGVEHVVAMVGQFLYIGTVGNGLSVGGYRIGGEVNVYVAIDVSAGVAATVYVTADEHVVRSLVPTESESAFVKRAGLKHQTGDIEVYLGGCRCGETTLMECIISTLGNIGIVATANELIVDNDCLGEVEGEGS